MKIALLTLGTRGDVQPYAVLGHALKQRGHQVTLSTAKNFEQLVRSYGIDFLPVDADFQAFLETDEGKKMMKNPFRARKNLEIWVYPMIYNSMRTFYKLAVNSDKVLYHIKTLGDYFADQFPRKMIRANVIPAFQPTKEFVNPVFSGLHLPAFFNKISYRLSDLGLRMMLKPIRSFREEEGLPKKIEKPQLPSIYGISPSYLEKPKDYPPDSYFTGFWTSPSQVALDPEILDFIAEGEPPLLLTFGSMPFVSGVDLHAVLTRITTVLNIRLIIVKGWGLYDTKALSNNKSIKVITSAPYDVLFPLVKAVIHHGGIGTAAACIQAGKPFFACPVMYPLGDQHFWATIGYKKGVALPPVPLKKLTEQLFIDRVNELLTNKQLYDNAERLSEQLRAENGVQNAAELIEHL
ncbi:glycosyltransferase [Chryseolinea sp. H1M3-3]|uniref:glycosyltransferase n=1 Tax=Chryseolinea sp. H1M3-3 TaxID=3034144 RepID=UPI0023EB42B1|nr:glycosyltransferase [Chryseolinea sp. H1M3-3]